MEPNQTPPPSPGELARRPASKVDQVKHLILAPKFRAAVAEALPRHFTPDRFLRVAALAITKNPKLAECSQESLFAAMLQVSSLGLECDGRRAHLIPFGKEVQLIIDYKGLAELILRSGEVSKLHADIVCDRDEFAYNLGVIEYHRINFRAPRGEPYAAYALAQMKDGAVASAVMTKDEIEGIRSRSRSAKNGPWVTDWAEMAKKTVFRRLSKWLPLSAELRNKVEVDDEGDFIDTTVAPAPNGDLLRPRPAQITEGEAPKRGPGRPPKKPAEEPPALTAAQSNLQKMLADDGISFEEFNQAAMEFGLLGTAVSELGQLTDESIVAILPNWDALREGIEGARQQTT